MRSFVAATILPKAPHLAFCRSGDVGFLVFAPVAAWKLHFNLALSQS